MTVKKKKKGQSVVLNVLKLDQRELGVVVMNKIRTIVKYRNTIETLVVNIGLHSVIFNDSIRYTDMPKILSVQKDLGVADLTFAVVPIGTEWDPVELKLNYEKATDEVASILYDNLLTEMYMECDCEVGIKTVRLYLTKYLSSIYVSFPDAYIQEALDWMISIRRRYSSLYDFCHDVVVYVDIISEYKKEKNEHLRWITMESTDLSVEKDNK